jgi:hypothetical protein
MVDEAALLAEKQLEHALARLRAQVERRMDEKLERRAAASRGRRRASNGTTTDAPAKRLGLLGRLLSYFHWRA